MEVPARSPGSINRGMMYREMGMRKLLLHLILHCSQICSDVLKGCRGQQRAGDCDGITEGPHARTLFLASCLHCSSAEPFTLCAL